MKRNLLPIISSLVAVSLFVPLVNLKAAALSAEGQEFVKKAAAGGTAEVKLSELANSRASAANVKEFAKQMVVDHTKANDELKVIAESDKIAWPTKLEGESETAYKELSKLSGAKFDAEYVKVMVGDHDKTVRAFEEASAKVKNPALKSFIEKTLPVLRQHQQHIHAIAQKA